jgi:putative ABC transport system permease protein
MMGVLAPEPTDQLRYPSNTVMHEIRNALRAMRAAPIVSAVAILSLALGIGANTAMFSILDSLLLRSLPVKDPHRLVLIGQLPNGRTSWTNPIWEAIRDRPELFDGALAWSSTRFNLSQGGPTEFVDGVWTTGRYFDVLGVRAILGRTWTKDDDRRGGGPDGAVAMISYAFWQRRFAGAADVIGRSLMVERVPFTIVGVTPPGFFGLDVGRTFDVAIPLGTEPLIRGKESSLDRRSNWWLNVMGRLRSDQSLEAAQAALRGVQPQLREATMPQDWREDDKQGYLKEPLMLDPAATGASGLRSRYQRPLNTLMVVVGLVLLIACANLANLLLARATARRHELSVRLALGASRAGLARQLLGESLVLSGLGAALGLLVARWFSSLLVRQLSTATTSVHLEMALDWRILGFTAAVAIATAVIFGTVPALRATRVDPHDAIKAQGRGIAGQNRFALGNLLVVVQVALSMVLLVGAGLFMRTFDSLANLDLGFDRGPVLVAGVNIQPLQLEPDGRGELLARLRDAALATPGVESAVLSVVTPISGSTWSYRLELLDGKPIETADKGVFVNLVGPDWFKTYGTKMLAGRDFTAADKRGAPSVAIVNEAFARKFTGGANPMGRRVREPARPSSPNPEREIVGYVADAAYRSLREPIPATMYLPFDQNTAAPSFASISVRAATGSPVLLTKGLASALTGVNGSVAITFRPIADQIDASLTQERLVATLSGFFGALALLLAALGLYGVTSYAVSRRRSEIGLRMALGAAPAGVVRMVLGRVALLVGVGVLAGLAASLWASTLVTPLLFGLPPRDPPTMIASALVLGAIGAFAGWLPALRAARIDPARVLRDG